MAKAAHGARSVLTVGLVIMLAITGCADPISEGTTKAVVERCKELGMATHVRNTAIDSTAYCVPVKKEQ